MCLAKKHKNVLAEHLQDLNEKNIHRKEEIDLLSTPTALNLNARQTWSNSSMIVVS